jgi:DNA-binding transcriptional LysR family regulator
LPSLDDFELFVGIVDAGSLSAAARARGLPKSSVTRRLAGLEAQLQARLIERNTRHLAPTDAGRRLYDRLRPIVADARTAEMEFMAEPSKPQGHIRLTATGAFGRLFIAPLLGEYLRQSNMVTAELILLDRPVSLIDEGFDLAIRMGALKDSGLVQRQLTTIPRILCATPEHLASLPPIARIDDLKTREGLVSVEGNRWSFDVAGRTTSIVPQRRLATNQLEVLLAAVLGGCGIAMLPEFLVAADLAAGRLVPVLADAQPVPGAAHALWPSKQNMPARSKRGLKAAVRRLERPEGQRRLSSSRA